MVQYQLFLIIATIVLLISIKSSVSFAFSSTKRIKANKLILKMSSSTITQGSFIPSGIQVKIVKPSVDEPGTCSVDSELFDLGEALKTVKKAVLFALPGAFTPTCSEKHLPGFIQLEAALRAKGVEDIYCLSVNDASVMKAWGQATSGYSNSGIKLLADGNAELTTAMGFQNDLSVVKMGIRSRRYALIIENGQVVSVNVDEKGFSKSSAEHILSLL